MTDNHEHDQWLLRQLFSADGAARADIVARYGFNSRSGQVWRWLSQTIAPTHNAVVYRLQRAPGGGTRFGLRLVAPGQFAGQQIEASSALPS